MDGRLGQLMQDARFLTTGEIDTSFGVGGSATIAVAEFSYTDTAVDREGRVLVGGRGVWDTGDGLGSAAHCEREATAVVPGVRDQDPTVRWTTTPSAAPPKRVSMNMPPSPKVGSTSPAAACASSGADATTRAARQTAEVRMGFRRGSGRVAGATRLIVVASRPRPPGDGGREVVDPYALTNHAEATTRIGVVRRDRRD